MSSDRKSPRPSPALPASGVAPGLSPPTVANPPTARSPASDAPTRLRSLDAFRGFIMLMLIAGGLGLPALARKPDVSPIWDLLPRAGVQRLAFHFTHPPWQSNLMPGAEDAGEGSPWLRVGVSFWDLIQPCFLFMVGLSLPFSEQRRQRQGQSFRRRAWHAAGRALALVLLGVMLYSQGKSSTLWIFPNVLAQIGLGYFFVFLLQQLRWRWMGVAAAGIMIGTWTLVHLTPALEATDLAALNINEMQGEVFAPPYRQWSKNLNAFHQFDVWFLNLFPRPEDEGPFLFNRGGYQTLNFVPSIVTMLLGAWCGQWVQREARPARCAGMLFAVAVGLLLGGVVAGATCCPVVKRIWTPSWTLFSGGYAVAILGAFYLLFDHSPLRRVASPLVVIGRNSLLIYLLSELTGGWFAATVQRHAGPLIRGVMRMTASALDAPSRWRISLEDAAALLTIELAPVTEHVLTLGALWLLAWWLDRQKLYFKL